VLANPKRLQILHFLRNNEMTVTELVVKMNVLKSNISQHLAIMRDNGILDSRRSGQNVYYRISNIKVIKAFDLMREVLIENHSRKNKLLAGSNKK
jgi:ArsR family transcriptional regulator